MMLVLVPWQNACAVEPDWSDYNALLAAHIYPGIRNGINLHLVDYSAWEQDVHWLKVLKMLADFDLAQLHGKDEKLAFWINAYNILAIHMVLEHKPANSIRDIGNWLLTVWKKDAGIVSGHIRTLHEIEHEFLRPMAEPRIHFAIVCASISCPDLRKAAYHSENLATVLNEQYQAFISNQGKGVRLNGNTIYISRIFDWFKEDFAASGGVAGWLPEGSEKAKRRIVYLDYDWSLNRG